MVDNTYFNASYFFVVRIQGSRSRVYEMYLREAAEVSN